jgi:hypothetical protein
MMRFRQLILWFWAVWLTIVALSNIADALKGTGILPAHFPFASGNFGFMKSVMAAFHPPALLAVLLFAGVIVWEVTAAVLHWRAALQRTRSSIENAFLVSAGLWAAFCIADEVFISYGVEATHLRLLIAAMVSVMVMRDATTVSDKSINPEIQ